MEKPTLEADIIIQKQLVNPEKVWGDKQKVVEIVGLGSGNGFGLKGINLPRDWEGSIDFLKGLDTKGLAMMNSYVCEKWGFGLEKIIYDKNNILTEAVIRKINNTGKEQSDVVAKISLAGIYTMEEECGEYLTKGLDHIAPAMIFQEIMARYLDIVWNGQEQNENFDYGYIGGGYGDSQIIGGFGPSDLKIPKHIFEINRQITDENYQIGFESKASNIAGRFGLDLLGIEFNDKGILSSVSVDGNATGYDLSSSYGHNNEYSGHNVDSAYQAAALHTVVAAHINYLLEKDWSKRKE